MTDTLDLSAIELKDPDVYLHGVPHESFQLLREHGVDVFGGSDNIRDAWSPFGNGDMLERAMLIALRFGWSKDEDLAMAFDIASDGGARALGIANYGLGVGCQSRLLLLPAENLAEAVVNRSLQRTVISNGRIVARHGAFVTNPA